MQKILPIIWQFFQRELYQLFYYNDNYSIELIIELIEIVILLVEKID